MALDAETRRRVQARAGQRCEYCRLPQRGSRLRFPLDHIVPKQHGGADGLENLALSCAGCNLHKGPNLATVTPEAGKLVRLFHPRTDRWEAHFAWNGPILTGLTAIGAATIRILAINEPDFVERRRAIMAEGWGFDA